MLAVTLFAVTVSGEACIIFLNKQPRRSPIPPKQPRSTPSEPAAATYWRDWDLGRGNPGEWMASRERKSKFLGFPLSSSRHLCLGKRRNLTADLRCIQCHVEYTTLDTPKISILPSSKHRLSSHLSPPPPTIPRLAPLADLPFELHSSFSQTRWRMRVRQSPACTHQCS